MITNFIRNIVQFGGTSTFEKARLAATYKGDHEAPSEDDLMAILLTLSGKDPETRPQIGFTTIVAKMEQSESRDKWNYIVKNLIILDRCVEFRFFIQDISQLQIQYVLYYQEMDPQFKPILVDQFIRKYFHYIKSKAYVYGKKTSSFNIPKEEKRSYFNGQTTEQIFEEVKLCSKLHDQIMDIGTSDKNGLLKYQVNQYVFQLLLYTLANLYSTCYISMLALLDRLLKMTLEQAKKLKELYTSYLKINEQIVQFINSHQQIKGYSEFNTAELGKVDFRIFSCVDEYVKIAEKSQNQIGLPDEIVLDSGLIDDELIFEAVETVRQSVHEIHSKAKYITRTENSRQTFIPQVAMPILMEQKISQFHSRMKEQSNINERCLTGCNQMHFQSFQNNYSTDYSEIEPEYKKSESIVFMQRNTSVQSVKQFSFEREIIDLQNEERIQFNFDAQFDENQFTKVQNAPCFHIQLADIDAFDAFDEFEDYEDDC